MCLRAGLYTGARARVMRARADIDSGAGFLGWLGEAPGGPAGAEPASVAGVIDLLRLFLDNPNHRTASRPGNETEGIEMNNARRKEITAIRARLEAVQAEFESIRDELESIKDAESEAFENMPESLQQSERGELAQAAVDALESAHGELDGVNLDDVLSYLDTASE